MSGVDLGTYHVRVVLANGEGFIQTWNTGRRYTHGTTSWQPLSAKPILPMWASEDDVADAVEWSFSDGNSSCDCNKRLYLDYAHQREPGDYECGEELAIASLTLIRPDGTERELEVRR